GTWIQGDDTHPGMSGTFAYSVGELAPGVFPASTPEGENALRVTPRAILTFRGTGVTWFGARTPIGGIAAVYVDGLFAGEVDCYAAAEEPHASLFTSGPLPAGIHTLAVEVTDRKNPLSTDFAVAIDSFDVAP
ncbi:MAG: hypothetical protein WBO23_01085, partial [Burkholderiales bacterium]